MLCFPNFYDLLYKISSNCVEAWTPQIFRTKSRYVIFVWRQIKGGLVWKKRIRDRKLENFCSNLFVSFLYWVIWNIFSSAWLSKARWKSDRASKINKNKTVSHRKQKHCKILDHHFRCIIAVLGQVIPEKDLNFRGCFVVEPRMPV